MGEKTTGGAVFAHIIIGAEFVLSLTDVLSVSAMSLPIRRNRRNYGYMRLFDRLFGRIT